MPARRLPAPLAAGATRGRPVRFSFDGRPFEGFEGEPLAAALLAAGQTTLSRSFRFHRPRGLMCSTGQCGWCECEVDDVPSVRSCRVPLRDGLRASGEHGLPSVRRDLLGVLGIAARWIPPTFYHHRFLRPRRLRKTYLDVIRWFGGRGRLHLDGRRPARSKRRASRRVDVLVVGAGRAGRAAAASAAERGASVLLVDADRIPASVAGGVEIAPETTVVGLYDGVALLAGPDELVQVEPAAVVAATGSYELLPAVAGSDRPGVLSARLVRRLIEEHGIVPGDEALLVGAGSDLSRAGELLADAGARVVEHVETEALLLIDGRARVVSAMVGDPRRPRRVRVDLVVFGDRTPAVELVLSAGADVRSDGGRIVPVVTAEGATSVAGLFVAGSAAGVVAADESPDEARRVGRAAAAHAADVRAGRVAEPAAGVAEPETHGAGGDGHRDLPAAAREGLPRNGSGRHDRPDATASPGTDVDRTGNVPGLPDAALVCFCEDVHVGELRREIGLEYGAAELLKRRTGALTGPCQGKYCLARFCQVAGLADSEASTLTLPTGRPPLRPVRLADLVASPDEPRDALA